MELRIVQSVNLLYSNYLIRIALGAGEYTKWGEQNFLQVKDEAVVVVYDEAVYPEGPSLPIVQNIFDELGAIPAGLAALHQTFVDDQ